MDVDSEDFVEAFVFLPTIIDLDIFRAWIQGLSETEVAHQLQNVNSQFKLSRSQLEAEVRSHFTQFFLMEPQFHSPDIYLTSKFGGPFQLDVSMKLNLIQMYYELDAAVLRELLGCKLNRKNRRRELEDISESTGVSLPSCHRQFDNLRRVIKHYSSVIVDEASPVLSNQTLTDIITMKFHLSQDLTRKYVAAVFANYHRFETNKRKQSLISFFDYQKCADDIMNNWTYQSREVGSFTDSDSSSYHPIELDQHFLQDLRSELRLLSDKKEYTDELKIKTLSKLKEITAESQMLPEFDSLYKKIVKAVINIGSNLNHAKAVKDLFIDVIEKIIEPCKSNSWTLKDMDNFQQAFCDSLNEYNSIKQHHTIRFLRTLFSCSLILYNRINIVAD